MSFTLLDSQFSVRVHVRFMFLVRGSGFGPPALVVVSRSDATGGGWAGPRSNVNLNVNVEANMNTNQEPPEPGSVNDTGPTR